MTISCVKFFSNECTALSEEKLPDVVLGVSAGVASTVMVCGLEQGIEGILTWFCSNPVQLQEGISLLGSINSISNLVVQVALKVFVFAYAIFIGPWFEEFLFRGVLHDVLGGAAGSTALKVGRVVANGLIFGACHCIPWIGTPNISAFVVTSVMGMMFEGLRMWRGNRVACTTAHMVHNGIAVGIMFI
jgi:membrane protease YdiL (CAAX protease family)